VTTPASTDPAPTTPAPTTTGALRSAAAPLRSTLRWAATHGLARAATTRQARAGNLDAQLLNDPALQADPYPVYERLREWHPFARGGFSKVTVHHDACVAVLRSDAFGVAIAPPEELPVPLRLLMRLAGPAQHPGPIDPPAMLAVDPPDHTRYRRLVSRTFTARAVAALRDRTTAIAAGLLDRLEAEASTEIDLVERYAGLLPVTVICEVLGVPEDMHAQFLVWGDRSAATLDMGLELHRYREVQENLGAINEWMRGHLRRLRSDPGDDLLSHLVTDVDESGGRLTEDELLATAVLLLGAGFETTVNLIGNGTAQLLAHPEQRAVLADDPTLWTNATDEVLRYDSPVQRTARRAMRDTEILGKPVAARELVVTVLAAANRDPAVFTDPHTFDVTRSNARDHVAFSSGIHYCLGAALARMEGEIALRALFERFPGLQPSGAPERRRLRTLRGFSRMPVRLGDPA
jgi:cytochrome P450